MTDGSVLDTTYDDAIAQSEKAIALLRVEGLGARSLRAESVAALRLLQRAGRTTEAGDRRRELELHAGYWRAVRRVQTGHWEDTAIDDHDDQRATPTALPDDELARRAESRIGLNSLYVLGRHLEVGGSRFFAPNCRLGDTTVELRVTELELPSTQTIGCTLVGTAERTVVSRALMRRTRLEIHGPTELTIEATRIEGGRLILESARPMQVVDCAFVRDAGERVQLTLAAPAIDFVGCDLTGLELLECRLDRMAYVGSDHDGLVITGGSLGPIEIRDE